ncbi:hypothetical protein E2I00_001897, partial [Balaenoptera physalus]
MPWDAPPHPWAPMARGPIQPSAGGQQGTPGQTKALCQPSSGQEFKKTGAFRPRASAAGGASPELIKSAQPGPQRPIASARGWPFLPLGGGPGSPRGRSARSPGPGGLWAVRHASGGYRGRSSGDRAATAVLEAWEGRSCRPRGISVPTCGQCGGVHPMGGAAGFWGVGGTGMRRPPGRAG